MIEMEPAVGRRSIIEDADERLGLRQRVRLGRDASRR